MKQLLIAYLCVLLLSSCFDNKPLESAGNTPIDSICHYYAIDLNEGDSLVKIEFASWPIADRNKRLLIPTVDKVEINSQILNFENNSYKLKIPIQNIKDEIITICYFSSDTVFYSKRIKLARFNRCKVIFHSNTNDDISVNFEPALNTFEELEVDLKGESSYHKRFDYNESIRNGISFNKNMGSQYGTDNKRIPVIQLQKLYAEKYTEPCFIEIRTSTEIEKEIRDTPDYFRE